MKFWDYRQTVRYEATTAVFFPIHFETVFLTSTAKILPFTLAAKSLSMHPANYSYTVHLFMVIFVRRRKVTNDSINFVVPLSRF